MQFLRRSLVGLFLLSVTLGLLAVAGNMMFEAARERLADTPRDRSARERVMAVTTLEMQPETVTPVLSVFGTVQSRRTLEIRAATGGRVAQLDRGLADGAEVTQGQLLALIDPSDAQSALAVARTDLAEAEAEERDAIRNLGLARDELAAAQAQADLRQRALARQRDLLARGSGTATAVETTELAASAAEQAVLARRIALAGAEARVDQAATRLDRARISLAEAERDLADTRITAAFSGTLSDVAIVEGRLLTANERIATLVDAQSLEVVFRVSTAQYARLIDETGQLIPAEVRARLDVLGLDLEAVGRLTRVDAEVGEAQTGRRIFASLDRHAGFRPGDFVSVLIEEPALEQVVRLPATALDGAGTVLALTDEPRLVSVPVTLLRRQGNEVIVSAPELHGRRVVAERSPLLGAGLKVRDLTAEREAPAPPPEVLLSPERRAALIALVEANTRMPEEARARVLDQLRQDRVPATLVDRLEQRAGG